MKKTIFALLISSVFYNDYKACAWSEPDLDYFNLFTQSIIRDKSYLPFLLSYSSRFYDDGKKAPIIDKNIQVWQKYFGNHINYLETEQLVNHIDAAQIQLYKNGNSSNPILQKLGNYATFREGLDYLIEAKTLQPYMRINYIESPDAFYYRDSENKNATQLDYQETHQQLVTLYHSILNPEIKLRYGYQIVRFQHYNRLYAEAVSSFKEYVEPLNLRSAPYYLALDQLAGAQRGLKQNEDANWNFFQVFINLNTRKESAYTSMKLSDSASFENLLKKAQTNEEKNMAYFLLAYEDFNNPLPIMEKMYSINPQSEILKVLAARSINQIERNYLPHYQASATELKQNTNTESQNTTTPQEKTTETKTTFWGKIINFIKNIFGKTKDNDHSTVAKSDQEILNQSNRLPVYNPQSLYYGNENVNEDFLNEIEQFTEKTKAKSDDEFWSIANAYLKFLKKDYAESSKILSEIKTENPEYITQINRMKILNDIVSQPKIDATFEEYITKNYPDLLAEQPKENQYEYNPYPTADTPGFIRDILANRYFLQGEDAKSFLMNNKLSDLQYNPNSDLVKKIETFYKKRNKTSFEKNVIAKNMDIQNPENFFNMIYGDAEMKQANFENAKKHYAKISDFEGIPRYFYNWDSETRQYQKENYKADDYNGFNNISDLIFGHNIWESFQSPEQQSMMAEDTSAFPFIKNKMNKLDLANALVELKKIGKGQNDNAAKASQLIGNLLYNTSALGYYRHVFVMDINNENGGKFGFWSTANETPYDYYYKFFTNQTFVKPDNFGLAIAYYEKALKQTQNREMQSRIVFQMASAEQGKFYQWEAQQPQVPYSDDKWYEKQQQQEKEFGNVKNEKFRTYFTLLKSNYQDTQTTKDLMGSCTYFNYFMKK